MSTSKEHQPIASVKGQLISFHNLVAQGKVKFSPYITHTLQGIEKLPEAIEITAYKGKYNAINPTVVIV